MRRSIRPTRARRPSDASVDPSEARCDRVKGIVCVRHLPAIRWLTPNSTADTTTSVGAVPWPMD
jgi:hypothetical protein